MAYKRNAAVEYAVKWALKRNPKYISFNGIGGDCTNFVSQCLFAGGAPMNYEKTFGWYYNSSTDRAPAWSSTMYLYNFLTSQKNIGPKGEKVGIEQIEPGDVIQLSFTPGVFSHSLIVLQTGEIPNEKNILIAAHTDDSLYRSLSTYYYAIEKRYIKISVR